NTTPSAAVDVVDAILAGQDVRPTRGSERVATFKETSRVLAGFDDGRAHEGTAGGPATMVGLDLARAAGWHAPGFARGGGPVGREGQADDVDPQVGATGSSSQRPPVSEGDVSPSGPGGARTVGGEDPPKDPEKARDTRAREAESGEDTGAGEQEGSTP